MPPRREPSMHRGGAVNVDDLTDPDHIAGATLRATFGSKAALRSGIVGGTFADPGTEAFPAVHPNPPTVTHAAAPTLTRIVSLADPGVYLTAGLPTYDTSQQRWGTSLPTTLDFVLLGDAVEITWDAAGTTGTDSWWIWVDGRPVTDMPAASGYTTSLGTTVTTKIAFGAVAPRRVTVYLDAVAYLRNLRIAPTAAVSTPPPRLRGLFVGDSFFQGAAGVPGWAYAAGNISRMLGVDCGNLAEGGTGYVATGPVYRVGAFGHPTKVAKAAAYRPDFLVFSGSVNDDSSAAQVQAAASKAFGDYAAACPGVPIIVFGPQPDNSTTTVSAARQANNAAVRAAAVAHPAVVAFHDVIGHAAGMPPAFSAGTTYTPGDLVVYQGSVWQWTRPVNGSGVAPGGSTQWSLATWLYTGTGKVGATAGDGSRDVYLSNDGVHPSLDGAKATAIRQAAAIRATLTAYALG